MLLGLVLDIIFGLPEQSSIVLGAVGLLLPGAETKVSQLYMTSTDEQDVIRLDVPGDKKQSFKSKRDFNKNSG